MFFPFVPVAPVLGIGQFVPLPIYHSMTRRGRLVENLRGFMLKNFDSTPTIPAIP